MKMIKTSILISIALTFTSCGGEVSSGESAEASKSTTSSVGTKDTINPYICPMTCENSGSKTPGICRVCEMDLATNPDYPNAEVLPIGEEPSGGQRFQDTVALDPEQPSEEQTDEKK
jgi:hypothetical protein